MASSFYSSVPWPLRHWRVRGCKGDGAEPTPCSPSPTGSSVPWATATGPERETVGCQISEKKNGRGSNTSILLKSKNIKDTAKKRIAIQRVSLVLLQNFPVPFSETQELSVLNSAPLECHFIIPKAGMHRLCL